MSERSADASKPTSTTPPTPAALRGLWRREEIFTPSGRRDDTTVVLWLQTERFYADIRVPADRPTQPGATSFEAFDDEALIKLAAVQGFAGVLTASADVCLWRRDLDYQPPGQIPDEARFEISGDRMAEFGVHSDYTELWRREPDSHEPLIAFQRETGGPGLLVIGGDHVVEIEGRSSPLPDGDDLEDIVRRLVADDRRNEAIAALEMRICYGRVSAGAAPWPVELSTLPWLEGEPLFAARPRFDPASGLLHGGADRWSLLESTVAPSQIAALFEA